MTKLNAKVGGIKITFHILYENHVRFLGKYGIWILLKDTLVLLLSTEDISQYIVCQRGQVINKKAESVWLVMK